ncbi:MAG: hypothetical protein K8R53_01205, partial [Bacteroidales bacterium]|nr:hypothetical protein [Bacteroidales bacterium]
MNFFVRYRYYALCLFLFVVKSGNGQQSDYTDSLIQAISVQEDDTNKALNLLSVAWEYSFSDPETALMFCLDASKLSDSLNYINGIARSLYYQSYIYKTKGNLDSAIFCINEYVTINDSI